jgi:redox-sensitive bicupin YhaK (pirin superfamily)
LGNDSVIEAGGTQRFTSGRGAYHSEMPAGGGPNRGMQLWVNLPRRLKQMTPNYVGSDANRFPVSKNAERTQRTVVGNGSPVELQTRVRYLDVTLSAGASLIEEIDEAMTALVYVVAGSVRAAGETLAEKEGILPAPGSLRVAALDSARVILLQGRPHREPIIHRGPFVD